MEHKTMNSTLTLSWRIGLPQWESDEAFERLLALLDEHRSVGVARSPVLAQ